MPNMLTERAEAYRAALRQALNDGLSIKAATDLAKTAARDAGNTPQQKPPVVLTDAELRLIDENELTAEECDRLLELEITEANAEEDALNATLPKASLHGSIVAVKSDIMNELAEALGYRVINVEVSREDLDGLLSPEVPSDEELDIMQAVREHEALEAKCGVFLVPNENIAEELFRRRMAKLEGNCEPEDYMTDQLGDGEEESLNAEALEDYDRDNAAEWAAMEREQRAFEHANEPNDPDWREQEMAKAELADAWRDAVGIVTPAGLRMTAKANFMAGLGEALDEALNPGCTDREMVGGVDAENGAEDAGPTAVPVRDCDVPATLRAIDIPATDHGNAIQQWFDDDSEMHQFLAGRCLYAAVDRSIKDEEGDVVGVWFYAHFGPTPVS